MSCVFRALRLLYACRGSVCCRRCDHAGGDAQSSGGFRAVGNQCGASFALALCLALLSGVSFSATVLFSFLGAAASLAVVYLLMSLKHRKLDPVRLVLAGSAVSMFLSSISQAVSIYFNIGYSLTFWTAGGVAGIRGDQLVFAAPVIALGLLLALLLSRQVSLLSLGDDTARGLGLQLERTRLLCLFVVLLLAGGAAALAGPVSFVGLLVPHVVRFFLGRRLSQHHSGIDGGRCVFHARGRFHLTHAERAERNADRSGFCDCRGAVLYLDCTKGGKEC